MDFRRNRVLVIDHAGSAGPEGGLPISGTAKELAAYLRKQKINYLIYSYSDEGGYGYAEFAHLLNLRGTPYYDRVRILAENNFKFHNQLVELCKNYKIIYKDNYSVLIDLASPES